MCGICGKVNFDSNAPVSAGLVKGMADTIGHRGPDDEGYHISGAVGLGFRRLSIIDLNTGHQPIPNENNSVWIVFNGEIYNYRELRAYLIDKGHTFRTHTDTEVIVHLYEEFGESCVEKLRGMFAFAIWDENNKTLFAARDRLGIKPFYYSLSNRSFMFASEIKAILVDPEVTARVRPAMIDRFLTFYYTPGEDTLFENIFKLAPGTTISIREGRATFRKYWDLHFSEDKIGFDEALTRIEDLLNQSMDLHLISDVPLGFLLSGGVDSTAMLGLAAEESKRTFSSFTLGFSDPGVVDERPYARLAAERYKSDHHEMTISANDFVTFLPKYTWHMEEPVCEPTAIALYYVSRLAKDFVKVLISGEGGDEAFAGYPNYRNLLWLERLKSLCGPFKEVASHGLSFANRYLQNPTLAKYAPLMKAPLESYYYSRISSPNFFFNREDNGLYDPSFAGLVNKQFSIEPVKQHFTASSDASVLNKMLYVDTKTALPDDLLLKADKMTMANSVELRVPLLDHVLLEFAATLPQNFKVHGFTTKFIAKRALTKTIPREIIKRKKVGFPVPFGSWLGKELKGYVQDILLQKRAVERGYFNRSRVNRLIDEHAATGHFPKEIFSLVSLELWHQIFVDGNRRGADSFIEAPALSAQN